MLKTSTTENRQRTSRWKRFKVGDTVTFMYAVKRIQGTVIEDRGPLAGRGQHIYRILVESDDVRRDLELPAEELEKAS